MAKKPQQTRNVSPSDEAMCLAEYTDLRSSMARLSQKIAAMFGRFEKLGVSQKEIKQIYKLQQEQNPDQTVKNFVGMAVRLGVIDGQGDFSNVLAAPKLSKEDSDILEAQRIRREGYECGYSASSLTNCKWKEGTRQHQLWHEGYSMGTHARYEDHPEKVAESTPAPRKRKADIDRQSAESVAPLAAAAGPAEKPKRGRPAGKKAAAAPALPPLYQEEPEPQPAKGPPLAYTVGDDEVEIVH